MEKYFKILSIDGGGFRGVYSAYILKCIQEKLKINLADSFDLIAGTSTGSIIAAGLACNIPIDKIIDLYKIHGKSIFKKRWFCKTGIMGSRYSNKHLACILTDTFKNLKLGNISKPLIIPSTDIGNGSVHVFKSKYHKEFVRDPDVFIKDAVLASCSAPTFFNPYKVKEYLLADGGLWANNPSLIAAIDARYRLGHELKNVKIFSLGTGTSRKVYSHQNSFLGWGFLTRWGGPKFIDMFLTLQAETTNNMLGLLLNKNQILRMNFESDAKLPLDDVSIYDDLVGRADKDFTYNAEKIRHFLEI